MIDKENSEIVNKIEESSDNTSEGLKEFLSFSMETIRVVIISLIVIFVIRSFIIQPFFVKGSSMQPNFHDGDYIIVDELSYKLDEPERGDVVIFRYPKDPSEYFIKRIIGLPGESVKIEDNTITIFSEGNSEGFVLEEEQYLPDANVTSGVYFAELGEGEYYVLGDNRTASRDSRAWGKLEEKFIIGKAWVRAWPFDDFAVFESLNY